MTINIGCPGGHIPLSTPEDFKEFLNQTNGMHDAYLLSADYRAHVRANPFEVVASAEGESLVLRYQVTSMLDLPIVELTFLNVAEWKAPNGELFGSMISFEEPFVIFYDGNTPENAATCVKARRLFWRIIDRPGNHLQRGGTEDAVWYVIPGLWLPMYENLENYTQIIEELSSTVEGAKLYHTRCRVRPLPCADAAFTTDHIHSFRAEDTTYAGGGSAFCWYELNDREALKNAVSTLDHEIPLCGNMIAICDDEGMVFTVELIEWGSFNMVICSRRGYLAADGFCGGKYYVEPYSGGGMEELS